MTFQRSKVPRSSDEGATTFRVPENSNAGQKLIIGFPVVLIRPR